MLLWAAAGVRTNSAFLSLAKPNYRLGLAGLKRATCHVPFGPKTQTQPNLLLAEHTFLHSFASTITVMRRHANRLRAWA
jgi:hypothetical protein